MKAVRVAKAEQIVARKQKYGTKPSGIMSTLMGMGGGGADSRDFGRYVPPPVGPGYIIPPVASFSTFRPSFLELIGIL